MTYRRGRLQPKTVLRFISVDLNWQSSTIYVKHDKCI